MEPRGNLGRVPRRPCYCGRWPTATQWQLTLSLNNKVTAGILYRLPPRRQRLSPKMSRAANRTVVSGIPTRILQSTSDSELITTCILALSYEAHHYKLDGCLLKQVIAHARAKAREINERNVEGALA